MNICTTLMTTNATLMRIQTTLMHMSRTLSNIHATLMHIDTNPNEYGCNPIDNPRNNDWESMEEPLGIHSEKHSIGC